MKAATANTEEIKAEQRISIHAAREGGDKFAPQRITPRKISIHAAREGGDEATFATCRSTTISIHAAREGGDYLPVIKVPIRNDFNPRRP